MPEALTWLEQMQQILKCCRNRAYPGTSWLQYAGVYLGTLIENLHLDTDFADDTTDCINNLRTFYAQIQCGKVPLDENAIWEILAQIEIAKKLYDEEHPSQPQDAAYFVWKAGLYSWVGTDPTASIAVVGLLSTDIVQATMTVNDTTQYLIEALNDAGNDQIDLTLNAAGTTNIRIAWSVLRPVAN